MQDFSLTQRDNGLQVVSTQTPSESLTLLVLVGAGSRYEELEISGISHFIEHMFFKGADKFINTKAVSEAIDSVGGQFNAFTGKEYAGYYVKLSLDKAEVAFDVLSDMLINPHFLTQEIDKERGVILEELNMYQDTPMYQIGWDFEQLLFGDQPLGRDQIGTKTFINSVTQEQFFDYHKALYTANNTVIAVAGNIEHQQVLNWVDKYFQFKHLNKSRSWANFQGFNEEDRVAVTNKISEQAHLCIGFPSYHLNHPDEYAAKLLAVVLGGNMSSRMFLNVREDKGLCYYINSHVDDFTDCGYLSTSAGVDVNRIDLAVESILKEYEAISSTTPVSTEELNKAKSYLHGKLVLQLEDTQYAAHVLGKQVLLGKEIKALPEMKKQIEKVTLEQVNRVAQEIFVANKSKLAYIGPERTKESFLLHLK